MAWIIRRKCLNELFKDNYEEKLKEDLLFLNNL